MGAKHKAVILCLALLAAPGCSGLARFAPPGILKYEDLAKGQPQSPVIKDRIAEAKKEDREGFPNLSETPSIAPAAMPEAEREKAVAALKTERASVAEQIAADRAAVEADRAATDAQTDEGSLAGARDALSDAVKKDDAAARKERGLGPREPSE